MNRRRLIVAVLGAAATFACAAASQEPSAANPSPMTPAGWLTYSDAEYGFAVSYPSEYAVLPESAVPPDGSARRVRFQDKALSAEAADLEPPRFTVSVFTLSQPTTLGDWLQATGRRPAGAVVTPTTVAGAQEGVRVQYPQQLAPNEFYYVSRGRYVYALVPLGQHSAAQIASFRLL
jgi:hypothetical protein